MMHYKFSVADFERMAAVGTRTEHDRVELIAGEIITMSPIGARRVGCISALTDLLAEGARHEAIPPVR